jgi:hypothetical protein
MRSFKTILLLANVPAVVFIATPAFAEEYVQLSTGIDYSTGDYGETADTDFLAIPVSIKYQAENFYIRAATSWVDVKGPSGFIPGDGGVTTGNTGGQVVSRSGLGDVNLTAGYSFFLGGSTFFDAVGKVKLPTASESKFLGTGSTDFTAQGEVLHSMGDVSVGAFGGRRFNGSSDLFELRDVWLGGAGVYYKKNKISLGLDYEWRQGSIAGAPDLSEATASLTYELSKALRLQGYTYTGFSDGSPDLGGGMQVLVRF